MPRVPTYQPNQVGPAETTTVRHVAANNNGGALGGVGEGLQTLGRDVGQYAEAQDRLNAENDDTQSRLIAADAGTAASATVSEYQQLQSSQAREAQGTYSQHLKTLHDDALAKATNPRQQRFLQERLTPLFGELNSQVASHAIKEARVERSSAYDSQIISYGEQARNTNDPAMRDKLIASATAAKRDQLINIEGLDPKVVPELFQNEELKAASQVHAGVLDKMFSVPDPDITEIGHYLNAYGDEMTSDLKAQTMGRLQKPLQDRQSRSDADLVMGLAVPESPVSGSKPGANLDTITAHAESGGREYTTSGARVTSPVGARGLMQVMPSTAANPGFGIKPSDGSPEQDARVGRQFRAKMEERYSGDLQKMWAAYNWGPGNVDKAVAAHGDNWLAHAPAVTQRYVLANVTAAGGAGNAYTGQAKEWDKAAVYSTIDKTAEREGWTPERTERARQEVDRRVARDDGLMKDQQSNADDAVAAIMAQKGDSFRTSMVPPDVWARLSPKDKVQYQHIETELLKPKDPPANSDTVVALHRMAITDPTKFAALNLEKYRPFVTAGEFDELGKSQAQAAKPDSAFDPQGKIDTTISRQKKWSGLDVDKRPTDGFRVRRYMQTQADAQRAGGKEPTQQDYDRWFGEAIQKPGTETHALLGLPSWLLNRTATDAVPQSYRDMIRRQFRSVNGRWPTDDETQEWYGKMAKPAS